MTKITTTEHKPHEGIYLEGETEYIEVKDGISGFFMIGKALSSQEIKDRSDRLSV